MLTTQDGVHLQGLLDMPDTNSPCPLAILLHGYSSRKESHTNEMLVPRLLDQGIACLRFDFRGHGQSAGDIGEMTITSGLSDLSSAIAWTYSKRSPTWTGVALVGSSYGGLISALYLTSHHDISCAVLKAPAFSWSQAKRFALEKHEIEKWRETGIWVAPSPLGDIDLPYDFYQDLMMHDVLRDAHKIDCPLFISHGTQDEAIPYQDSVILADLLGDKATLQILPGADHRFTDPKDASTFTDEAVLFLTQHLVS